MEGFQTFASLAVIIVIINCFFKLIKNIEIQGRN